MASLYRRKDGRVEIRETVRTERGPRSRTLALFRGALSPDVLESAESRASRPFDRRALMRRAAELGVPVTKRREDRAARAFLRALRQGLPIDPAILRTLKDLLARADVRPVPGRLAEVVEWIGVGSAERGEALRGLLRVYDRVVQSREPVRVRDERRFPRFRSRAPGRTG